jgi:hypothetical protein
MSYCLAVGISRQAYRGTESPLRIGFKGSGFACRRPQTLRHADRGAEKSVKIVVEYRITEPRTSPQKLL